MSFTKKQLLPGENLVILIHEHWLVLARPSIVNIVVLGLLIALGMNLGKMWPLYFYPLPLAYLLWEVWDRSRREYIVTNRRVVKQEGVLSVSSFDAPLDKINNVFHEQSLLGRMLGYGNVGLETASEQGTTMFYRIPSPVEFKNTIVHNREVYTSSARSGDGTSPAEDVPRLIQDLASLRERNIITAEEFEVKKRALLDKIR